MSALCFVDIVIDTNILVYAGDPSSALQADSVALISAMLDSTTLLCVDVGFTLSESSNASIIGHEYLRHLGAGSIGAALIATLAGAGRIKPLPKRAQTPADAKSVDQLIRKKRDRAFLGVACNSARKLLVSHDFEDFQKPKRTSIKKILSVQVKTAKECLALTS